MQHAQTVALVESGVYRHFKGNTYHVLGVATDQHGDMFVTYIPQKGSYAHKLSHRPLAMFLESVDKPELSFRGSRFTLESAIDILGPLVMEAIRKETGHEGNSDVVLGVSENTETGERHLVTVTMVNGSPQTLHLRTP